MAGRIALDLKAFKHVKSDDNCTTLEHKDGHQLTIAHKALSKEGKDQLAALSKAPKDSQKPADKSDMKDAQRYADGGKVADKDKKKSTIVASKASDGVKTSNKMKEEGEESEHGNTIVVLDPEEDKKDYGKVSVKEDRKKMAEGGDVPEYLKGNPDAPVAQTPLDSATQIPTEIPSEAIDQARQQQFESEMAKIKAPGNYTGQDPLVLEQAALNSIEGQKADAEAKVQFEAAQKDAKQKQIDEINGQKIRLGMQPSVPQEPGPQIPGSPQAPAAPSPDRLPQSANPGGPMQPAMDNVADMMQSGYKNQMQGIQQQAAAVGDLGQQQAAILQQQVDAQNAAQSAYKQSYDSLDKERQAHMADVQNGYIDPNKYWTGDKNGNGSHSKIMAGIGMILAGFNPTSQPNAAMAFLNKQMEMNLEAQKQNLGMKQSLLNANLRQFGNLKDATDMTRLMQADVVHNQLMQAAGTAQTPMAKAAALKAAGELQMQYAPLQQQFAMRRAMMNLSNAGNPSDTEAAEQMIAYARMTNPEMAKEMESRLVPGVGMAKIPIPEKARSELVAHQKLTDAAQDLLKFTKGHTTLNPMSKDYAIGQQKAQTLQSFIREGMLGTVYKEGEQPLLDKFVNSNPAGAMKMIQTVPKLQELLKSNNMQINAIKNSYGLPTHEQADPQQQALQWAKSNPKDPRAAKILQHLGKK